MKDTRAFGLEPMGKVERVKVRVKGEDRWVPLREPGDKHVFVYGAGTIAVRKDAKRVSVEPLPKEWTAEQVRKVYLEYGYSGAQAMLKGWGAWSLWDDNSYGLAYHKAEVGNMCVYGKAYDDFTDEMKAAGDGFV